ncbi:hypothetical protein ACPRNU_01690 [Chromobacterium vaccinii]|uniref:hypothetical protein n=1 Tax=Chromobacterium vaccinii TaxID=1108595 RepID=UPI003C784A41
MMKLKPGLGRAAAYWLLLCLLPSLPAAAAEATVRAELKPSSFRPGQNQFVNQGPADYLIGGLGKISKRASQNSSDPKDHIYQAIDAEYKQLTLYSGGDAITVKFRIASFAQRYYKPKYISNFNVERLEGGCQDKVDEGDVHMYIFEWSHAAKRNSVCYRKLRTTATGLDVSLLGFKYELLAVNPTSMRNGTYTGTLSYTLGEGQQLDFGRAAYSDNRLIIRIEATVKNEFLVSFPAGTDRAVLEPAGGWQAWSQQGRAPVVLRRDLGFSLSSATSFSLSLRCQYSSGAGCALRRDNGGGEVPIQVAVSMPGVYSSQGGAPASRYPLGIARKGFRPSGQVSNSAAQLHFEMQRADMAAIIKQPGARYRGDVTVVFDANL